MREGNRKMVKEELQLSQLISDGMVLQRNRPITIKGKALKNQLITLYFQDQVYETVSDEEGIWEVILSDLITGGPYEMTIEGKSRKIIKEVLVGDVYLLGGQSNMELPLSRTLDCYEEEIKKTHEPFIRQFIVPQKPYFHGPLTTLEGGRWESAVQPMINQFSAVGYFYARALYEQYKIPIGLIQTAVGGTPIEAWMKEDTLCTIADRYKDLINQCKDDQYIYSVQKQDEIGNALWERTLRSKDLGLQDIEKPWYRVAPHKENWKFFEVPHIFEGTSLEGFLGAVWFKKRFEVPESWVGKKALLHLGAIVEADETYVNGVCVGTTGYRYPPRRYEIPLGILKKDDNTIMIRVISRNYHGGFVPEKPYTLSCEGERIDLSGTWEYCVGGRMAEEAPGYTFFHYKPSGLYNGMITPLKEYSIRAVLWYQGESNTDEPTHYDQLFRAMVSDWRETFKDEALPFIWVQLAKYLDPVLPDESDRWACLRAAQMRCLDLSKTAMATALDLGEKTDLHPQYKKELGERLALCARHLLEQEEVIYSGPVYERMESDGERLHLYFKHIGSGLVLEHKSSCAFLVSGKDGIYKEAQVKIENNHLIVWAEGIDQPVGVKYAWENCPTGSLLYNKEGLLAPPFWETL